MTRCAIYTRKSSSEGLEQEFNSLDAQREACEAYALSQAGEGWSTLPDRYDDGGYSGGTMERPALKRLLRDVAAGKIDVVIVYKIDRLTRSLPDFARIVEKFDAREVSFVSVTQAFNTTSSMGRLTLNVLLSFAQFEREVTGERIRDKIAASKAKGMWMGGTVPQGYDPPIDSERKLEVNEADAEIVRHIFKRYLALGSVQKLHAELNAQGIQTRQRITAGGRTIASHRFSRTGLFHLIRNPIYIGRIVHCGKSYQGRHDAIVPHDLFEQCQKLLRRCTARRRKNTRTNAPLTGKLFNEKGMKLSPTYSTGSSGNRHHYYAVIGSPRGQIGDVHRVSAPVLEQFVGTALGRIGNSDGARAKILERIELCEQHTRLFIADRLGPRIEHTLAQGEFAEPAEVLPDTICWTIPSRWNDTLKIAIGSYKTTRHDATLIRALRRAHGWLDYDRQGNPSFGPLPRGCYERRILKLAFLAPDIQAQILAGRQPLGLSLEKLVRGSMPLEWTEQRKWVEGL